MQHGNSLAALSFDSLVSHIHSLERKSAQKRSCFEFLQEPTATFQRMTLPAAVFHVNNNVEALDSSLFTLLAAEISAINIV